MKDQPKLFLIGGPNRAGKSTFAHEFLADNPDFIFLNADEIAKSIQPENVRGARIPAGRAFVGRMAELRTMRANLVVESTLSGLSLAQQLRQFVAAGYHITLVYVFLPTWELSANRVAGRVLEGGHDIPMADIMRRFARSKKNFWHTYRLLADEWQMVLNADARFVYVAQFQNHNLTVQVSPVFQAFIEEQGLNS